MKSRGLQRVFAAALIICGSQAFAAEQDAATQTPVPPPPVNGLTYKGVNIQLGGFLASETVYRNNNTASDIATAFQKIPFGNSAGYGMSEFRGTERQSRFSLLAQGDYNEDTHLAGYYELDFLGTGPTSNANESNSYNVRTRNVYGTVDWANGWHVLAGQNWSLATLYTKGLNPRQEAVPQTIDAQYAVGFNWARQWQTRIVKDFNKTVWVGLSFENPQTTVGGALATGTTNTYALAGVQLMPSTSNYSFGSWPDIILKVAVDPGFGHYEVYNLAREFVSRYGATAATQTNKQSTWSDAIGAGLVVPVVPTTLDLSLSGLFGKGIGRYGTASLADVSYSSDGSLNPLTGSQWLAQLMLHATSTLDVWATYGQESISSSNNGDNSGYGDNVVADNSGCTVLGGTCAPNIKDLQQANIGAWWSFYKGAFGAAKLGLQYSHTVLDTFSDRAGNSPSTAIDMGYTSLRYYPF